MIQEQIKNDMKAAMLSKDAPTRDLLRVVIGEFNRIGKEVSDEKALAIIKKMNINAVEQKNDFEVKVLSSYLPKQMGEEDLTKTIQTIANENSFTSMQSMGQLMGKLKAQYSGTYDGKKASDIVKIVLTSNQIQ